MKQLIGKVLSEPLSKADVIVCLEGDGQKRTEKALELFENKWAPIIVVSGGYDNPPFSIVSGKMAGYLIENGVQEKKIIIEQNSKNTKEQAEEVIKIINQKGWKKIILVASEFHQLRAYLTFLKAMEDSGRRIIIINAPAKDNHKLLLDEEFEKIKEYQKKGHVLALERAMAYQKWKKKQQ